MEVLAARYRLGEHLWTFPSRHKKALRSLASKGLVETLSGVTENTVQAILTERGKSSWLSDTYVPPTVGDGKINSKAGNADSCSDSPGRGA